MRHQVLQEVQRMGSNLLVTFELTLCPLKPKFTPARIQKDDSILLLSYLQVADDFFSYLGAVATARKAERGQSIFHCQLALIVALTS